VRYGALNAEATKSVPGNGWKLNRSNPRSLLMYTRVPVAALSRFGGTATETSVRKARPPEADRNRVGKELVKGQGSPCWPRQVRSGQGCAPGERSSAYTKGRARLAAGQSAS